VNKDLYYTLYNDVYSQHRSRVHSLRVMLWLGGISQHQTCVQLLSTQCYAA